MQMLCSELWSASRKWNPNFGMLVHRKISLEANETQRNAWLMNWLANLTGREDSFKEMDLLQEHQNFWDKVRLESKLSSLAHDDNAQVVYNAKGSNRTWEWLSMVSVSIFALRDVICTVQKEFQTPFNSGSHTSPLTETDIQVLRHYLESQNLQSYHPDRENNDAAIEVQDIAVGSEYANKPAAFRNFTYTKFPMISHGLSEAAPPAALDTQELTQDDTAFDYDVGSDLMVEFDDLTLDEDEYSGSGDYVAMIHEVIDELSHYG
jgi:hypothetical protein